MQKDFKIGLAIGTVLAAGVIIWLATLPNLSARARALQAASNANPAPQIPADISPPVAFPQSTDGVLPSPSDEPRVTSNEQPQRIHVVQKGDTLSSISAKYYGSARQWRKIVLANRDNLPDPNRLTPGVKLLIPQ